MPSVTVQFPADNIDPGPRAGKLPTNPMLVNGPVVNYALLNSLYPSGSLQRNTGDVFLDSPNRSQPYTQQISVGYQRQLGPALSASADYVHTMARDQWLLENLNPGLRVNTTASGAINRVDPTYVTNVWQRQNIGEYTYDALNVVLEKRDSHNWSGRVSYTLANSRGNNSGALTSHEQLPGAEQSESRSRPGADRLRPPPQPGAQRPHQRRAAHARHDLERHAADAERHWRSA